DMTAESAPRSMKRGPNQPRHRAPAVRRLLLQPRWQPPRGRGLVWEDQATSMYSSDSRRLVAFHCTEGQTIAGPRRQLTLAPTEVVTPQPLPRFPGPAFVETASAIRLLTTMPPTTRTPPATVVMVGVSAIPGSIAASNVAPTASPSTVRLTTYAGKYRRA